MTDTANQPDSSLATSEEESALCLTFPLFSWVTPLIERSSEKKARGEQIDAADLLRIPADESLDSVYTKRYLIEWTAEVAAPSGEGGRPSLIAVLRRCFGREIFIGFVLRFFADGITVCVPLVLRLQINWILDYIADANDATAWKGYVIAIALGTMIACTSLLANLSSIYTAKPFTAMRTVVMAAIYDKVAVLPGSFGQVGRITQLHGSDATKFINAAAYLQSALTSIPMIAGAVAALYVFIGPAAFIGLAVALLSVPIQTKVASFTTELRREVMKAGDRRMQRVNEFVQGIRIIKFMAWEAQFEQTTAQARRRELASMLPMLYSRNAFSAFSTYIPSLVSFVTFACAYALGNEMRTADVMASLALLSVMRMPLSALSFYGAVLGDLAVVTRRMEDFLLVPEHRSCVQEVSSPPPTPRGDDASIYVSSVSVMYDSKKAGCPPTPITPAAFMVPQGGDGTAAPVVADGLAVLMTVTDLTIPRGALTVVIGATASGKSTLVSALVGEADVSDDSAVYRCGSLAYVAQEAWIMNETVRNNILMGRPFQERDYKAAVLACQLKSDFVQLPGSDLTEIGERGINLSGGQKQRVALARAVYANADVVIMDDPLSAVDPHVCGALFHGCVRGALAGKTRVLVTHQQQFLQWADHIIVMHGLGVVFSGTYHELCGRPQIAALTAAASNSKSDGVVHEGDAAGDSDATLVSLTDDQIDAYTIPPPTAPVPLPTEASASSPSSGAALMSREDIKSSEGLGAFRWYYSQTGWHWFAMIILAFAAARTSSALSDYMLTWWATRTKAFGQYTLTPSEYCMWYGVLTAITGVVMHCRVWPLVRAANGANETVHRQLIQRLLAAPVAFYDTTPVGRILSRCGKDMETVDLSIPELLNSLYNLGFNALGAWVLQAVAAWFMPLVYVVVLVIFARLFRGYLAANHDVRYLDSVLRSPVMGLMNETLSGLQTLRAYGMLSTLRERHALKLEEMLRATYSARNLQRWLAVRTDLLTASVVVTVGVICAAMLQTLSPSDRAANGPAMIVGLTAVVVVPQLIGLLTGLVAELVAAFSSIERLREYSEQLVQERALEYVEEGTSNVERNAEGIVVKAPAPAPNWPSRGELIFDRVYARYRPGLDLVLKDVSFAVAAGEKVGVVGRTGSGKSTVMQCIFRMIETAQDVLQFDEAGRPANRIMIDGTDISHVKLHDLRCKVTIIPQDPLLFQGTVRSNLDPFGDHTDASIWAALDKVHMRDRVQKEDDGLLCGVAERGQNFSAGERQLLCLARALLKGCRILLLDEATASIDPKHDQIVQQTIRSEFADRTVLTIAHRLGTIIDSDKVLVLGHGKVIEFGSPADLLDREGGEFAAMLRELGPVEEARLRGIAKEADLLRRAGGCEAPAVSAPF